MQVMTENKVVPKLRFKEFSCKLNKYPFSELVQKRNDTYNSITNQKRYQCIELESISQNTGQLIKSFDSRSLRSNKTKFKKGDVLFGKLRPYLKKYLFTTFDGVCTTEIWVFNGLKVINSYLFQLVQTPKFLSVSCMTSGTKMPRSNWDYVKNIQYLVPPLLEQQKIADFLSSVDNKLQHLKKKKELLEQYKKGLMQKIFSQEIRFKDDNGNDYPDWEEKKLGEIGEFRTSSVDKLINEDEKMVSLVNYMDVYNHRTVTNKNTKHLMQVSATERQLETSSLIRGDVLFTPSSETPTDIGHSIVIFEDLKNTLFSYHLIRFRPKIKLEVLYSHYFCNIHSVLRQLAKYATGSTRFTISADSFSKIIIHLPSLSEQKKIADFLSSVDSKIKLVDTQITQTESFKKGLLQQMFV